MAGYEYCIFIGNVGRSPEMRFTQAGVAVADFSLAVNRQWTDRNSGERMEETKWIRVTAWRALAETVNTHIHRGMQVMVTGEVKASAYLDNDGKPRATLEVTARDILFLGRRGDTAHDDEGEPDEQEEMPF